MNSVFHMLGGDVFLQTFYEISTILLAGAITVHAALSVFRAFRELLNQQPSLSFSPAAIEQSNVIQVTPRLRRIIPPENLLKFVFDLGWLSVAFGLLILWPEALDVFLYPRRSFIFFAAIAIFAVILNHTLVERSKFSRLLMIVSGILRVVATMICIYLAFRYLVFVRPRMEGPDFYYYVCTARHMAWGFEDISLIRYFYFPGVYSFWRFAMAMGDGSLQSLQWSYFWVITANGLLVGGIIQRVTGNIYSAVAALLWYIGICSRFEGFIGATEPIATLPILAGLLLWGGRTFLGRVGLWRILAVGTGFGLGLYVRQQAGTVSLGAISLVVTYFVQRASNPIITLKRLILLPISAAVVFLVGILMEGWGLQPLWIGIQHIQAYGSTVNSWSMIRYSASVAGIFSIFSICALLFWLISLILPRFRSVIFTPWGQMLGFTCIAGFLSLLPFFSRPHLHYGLIAGPMLIISVVVTFVVVGRSLPKVYKDAPVIQFLVVILVFFPFIRQFPDKGYFYIWPVEKPVRFPQSRPWRLSPGLLNDLKTLKKYLNERENIYVLPPRQNDVHFFLGTRHSFYGWGSPMPLTAVLNQPELQGVIVVDAGVLPNYVVVGASSGFQYDRAAEIMTKQGFTPIVRLTTLTLWRPDEVARQKVRDTKRLFE